MAVFNLDHLNALAANEPKLIAHPVQVGEWGAGMVAHVAELTADERDTRIDLTWHAYKTENGKADNAHYRAWIAAACWCDAHRCFVAKEPKDIEAVAKKFGNFSAKPVSRMYELAVKVNGLIEDEDAEKNSPPAVDGNGTSPSTPDLLAEVLG